MTTIVDELTRRGAAHRSRRARGMGRPALPASAAGWEGCVPVRQPASNLRESFVSGGKLAVTIEERGDGGNRGDRAV